MTELLRAMPRFLKPASVGLAGALLLLSNGFAKAEWPNLLEAKAIAEEGFIYGLPIVMNYAVMYEYSVDKNSGQYKAPFNQIKNENHSAPTAATKLAMLRIALRASGSIGTHNCQQCGMRGQTSSRLCGLLRFSFSAMRTASSRKISSLPT
jgi:hypothetical protein